MLAKLKPMREIIDSCKILNKNNHYWKFYYEDKNTLGFRDFYLKYWKGNRLVEIKPKRDRKKNIIPGKYEIYGKRGNYVFTVYDCWFEWKMASTVKLEPPEKPMKKPKYNLTDLPWDQLFEV